MTSRGVLVVGMHRSGTSAVTRIVNLLGLSVCRPDDLMPHLAGNARGHWESQTLMWLNEGLLATIGARWNRLPTVAAPVETWHALAQHAAMARRTFDQVHPTPTWVWKDPRLCVLLPFWRTVLACDPPVVLVVRHPYDIAVSLATRDGLPIDQGLLLWERSMRHALLGCQSAPTYVVHYDDVIDDPVRVSEALVTFLRGTGLPVSSADLEIGDFIDPRLRHSKANQRGPNQLTDDQERLWTQIAGMHGAHPRFVGPKNDHSESEPNLPGLDCSNSGAWADWLQLAIQRGCSLLEIGTTMTQSGLTSQQISAAFTKAFTAPGYVLEACQ